MCLHLVKTTDFLDRFCHVTLQPQTCMSSYLAKSYKQCKHSGWIALQKKVEMFVRAHIMRKTDMFCTEMFSHSFNSYSPWNYGNDHISAPKSSWKSWLARTSKPLFVHIIYHSSSQSVSQVWMLFHWFVGKRGHISVRLLLHPLFIMILSKTISSPKFFK